MTRVNPAMVGDVSQSQKDTRWDSSHRSSQGSQIHRDGQPNHGFKGLRRWVVGSLTGTASGLGRRKAGAWWHSSANALSIAHCPRTDGEGGRFCFILVSPQLKNIWLDFPGQMGVAQEMKGTAYLGNDLGTHN